MSRERPSKSSSFIENCYNRIWLAAHGLTPTGFVAVDEFGNAAASKADASPYMVGWLRNIDRLAVAASRLVPLERLHFLDVGCGEGVATFYAAHRYPFVRAGGFDFEPRFVSAAIRSRSARRKLSHCHFFVGDATQVQLPVDRYFLYLFNPFGVRTLHEFLHNNLAMLRATESIIAMTNDHGVEELIACDGVELAARFDKYNSSLLVCLPSPDVA